MGGHGHVTLRIVTTGLDPVVHAVATRPERRWERCASEASAWIAGSKSGNDEWVRTKKSEAERRQTQCVFCRAVRARPRLSAERRTSICGPPRFSPPGAFHRHRLR